MEAINFYIPSEAQILLTSESVNVIDYRFHILEDDDALYLQIFFESYEDREIIPEPICMQICDLANRHRLTHAAVNQLLLPLKKKLIEAVPEPENETQINISRLFTSAKGYVLKQDQPVAVFMSGALCPDVFNNQYAICFTLPVENTDKVILLSSKDNLLQEQQLFLFMFYSYGHIYQMTAFFKNGVFYLQQITQASSMQHQDMFETDRPLPDIYRRFTMKKNRLGALLNKTT